MQIYALSKTLNHFCRPVYRAIQIKRDSKQCLPLSSKLPCLWLREEKFLEKWIPACVLVISIWLADVFHLAYMMFKIIFWFGCQLSETGKFEIQTQILRFTWKFGNSGSTGSSFSYDKFVWCQVIARPFGWASLWFPRVPHSPTYCDFCSLSPTLLLGGMILLSLARWGVAKL